MPELIRRKDGANDEPAEWTIKPCAAERGAPMTAVLPKEMHAPIQDFELDRVIRAHEMMHAKVSPADKRTWIERGIATERGMVAVEEARVNFLIAKVGFDVSILEDNTELVAGERISERGDWEEAVYFTAALSGCGGMNKFLVGIRRHRPAWAPRLRRIHELLQKELRRIDRAADRGGDTPLMSTRTNSGRLDPSKELVRGYFHVEAIAEWLDRLAEEPHKDEEQEEDEENQSQEGEGEDNERTEGNDTEKGDPASAGVGAKNEGNFNPPLSKADLEAQKPTTNREAGSWAQLNVKEQNLTRQQ